MPIPMILLSAAMQAGAAVAATQPATATVLPTSYEAGHFYATPETTGGQRLKLLVDTGGGGAANLYWITARAGKRLHLKTHACKLGEDSFTVAALPDYMRGHGLPPPQGSPCGEVVMVQNVGEHAMAGDDGQFSGSYLYANGIWTFDYPAHRLLLLGRTWHPDPAAHATRLGFQRDAQGKATTGYARITVHIGGEPIAMLLDTGATAHPTSEGERASHVPTVNGIGVTSYIVRSVFERWHKAHPAWRVVENGDDLFGRGRVEPMIEVPRVEIAGWSVGPVWFVQRPDPAFHGMMSSMMDKRIDGAVGGNVFKHFVMTIDYPRAVAYFACTRGCKAVTTPPPEP